MEKQFLQFKELEIYGAPKKCAIWTGLPYFLHMVQNSPQQLSRLPNLTLHFF